MWSVESGLNIVHLLIGVLPDGQGAVTGLTDVRELSRAMKTAPDDSVSGNIYVNHSIICSRNPIFLLLTDLIFTVIGFELIQHALADCRCWRCWLFVLVCHNRNR